MAQIIPEERRGSSFWHRYRCQVGGRDSAIQGDGWIFGYKLHITSSTGSPLIVPLSADFTTANVQENNQLYVPLTSNLPPGVQNAAGDSGYDDQKLYDYSRDVLGIDLVCQISRYEHTPADRLELMMHFYESVIDQTISTTVGGAYR
jgi:hypothetical protein